MGRKHRWSLKCLKINTFMSHDDSGKKTLEHDGKPSRSRHQTVSSLGSALVELTKKDGCNLGLVVSGGIDKESRPRVSYLRPGGIAHRSDVLQVGDYILAINAIRTVMLRHEEIINLLKNAGHKLLLEIEYELPDSPQSTFSVLCKRVEVRLEREGDTFGFVLRGGAHNDPDKSRPLTVTFIRPGSSADREGTLKIGDRILAINRVNVTQLSLTESSRILRHTDQYVTLLVEYDASVMEAVQNACTPLLVEIDKAAGTSLGITLTSRVSKAHKQILINTIQPASIADRCGALHVGDQILSIDDTSLDHMSVPEATQLLRGCHTNQIRLEIIPVTSAIRHHKPNTTETPAKEFFGRQRINSSYDATGSIQSVASYTSLTTQVGSAVDGATVPPSHHQHNTLTNGVHQGFDKHQTSAGTHPGIRGTHSETIGTHPGAMGTHPGAMGAHPGTMGTNACTLPGKPSNSAHSSFHMGQGQCNTLKATASSWVREELKHSARCSTLSHTSHNTINLQASTQQVCHTDTTEVTLAICDQSLQLDSDRIGYAYGILLQEGSPDDILLESPIITHIQPGSPAERTGILQEGDRVVSVNGTVVRNLSYSDLATLFVPGTGNLPLNLEIEFDVADSIVPSSGIFNVKLFKRGAGLGIIISSSANRKDSDPLIISNVKKGSVAHRTGTIQPGDKLLAIDRVQMDNCTIEDAAQVLQNTGDIVKLKIKKDEIFAEECNSACVTYTVELQKQNGPLGITISGTEELFDPIIISGLSDGGLAQKTGALHVCDRILAINGVSLRGRPLSDAIQMLQEAGDAVTFRITRPNKPKTTDALKSTTYEENGDKSCTPLQSVDSALESWDSSGLDSNQAKSTTTTATTNTNTTSNTCNSSNSSHDVPTQMIKSGTYNDLNQELHLVTAPGTYDPPESCPSSAGGEQDAWSRALDKLDTIYTPEMVHNSETTSVASHDLTVPPPTPYLSPQTDATDIDLESNESYTTSTKMGADLHIKEVEEQLQNIFTPTPVQLHRVKLYRENELEDFGFCLSDGVYEKGVYISAIRHGGPADKSGLLKPFDRLLQVNDLKTKDLECHQIVPSISDSALTLELVISRNPIASQLQIRGGITVQQRGSLQSITRPISRLSSGVSSAVSSRLSTDLQTGGVPSSGLDVDEDGELISVNVLLENLDSPSRNSGSDDTDDIWQPRSTTATVIRAPTKVRIDDKLQVETV